MTEPTPDWVNVEVFGASGDGVHDDTGAIQAAVDSVLPKTYRCSRCGRLNPGYLTFETGWPRRSRYWCLGHAPRWTRIKMRLRGTA